MKAGMKIFVMILVMSFCKPSLSMKMDYSLGIGLRHSVIGGQIVFKDGRHRPYVSIGALTAGFGYEYELNSQSLIGLGYSHTSLPLVGELNVLMANYVHCLKLSDSKELQINVGPVYGKFDGEEKLSASFGVGIYFK